jgi:hypothetical protein
VIAALALMAAAPSSPVILYIYTTAHGAQFAYFSSFERCESFRRQLEADWDRRAREALRITDPKQPTPKPVLGTGSEFRCIPG